MGKYTGMQKGGYTNAVKEQYTRSRPQSVSDIIGYIPSVGDIVSPEGVVSPHQKKKEKLKRRYTSKKEYVHETNGKSKSYTGVKPGMYTGRMQGDYIKPWIKRDPIYDAQQRARMKSLEAKNGPYPFGTIKHIPHIPQAQRTMYDESGRPVGQQQMEAVARGEGDATRVSRQRQPGLISGAMMKFGEEAFKGAGRLAGDIGAFAGRTARAAEQTQVSRDSRTMSPKQIKLLETFGRSPSAKPSVEVQIGKKLGEEAAVAKRKTQAGVEAAKQQVSEAINKREKEAGKFVKDIGSK